MSGAAEDAPEARDAARPVGLRPSACAPRGALRVPVSKSEALRAIVIAARADWLAEPVTIGPLAEEVVDDAREAASPASDGVSRASGALGADVAAALAVASALGARVERADRARVIVTPRPGDHRSKDLVRLEVGESATLARFSTAIAALDPHYAAARVAGAGTLARRRSPALFRALAAAGAEIAFEAAEHGWPARVRGRRGAPLPVYVLDAPGSSQEVSALLCAGGGPDAHHPPLWVRGAIPSRPYLDLSIRALRAFGVIVREEEPDVEVLGGGTTAFRVEPAGAPAPGPVSIELEADASLAAVALAAACLEGGELRVPGIAPGSAQGDARIAAHLAAFGCDAALDARGLRAGGRPTRGAELDLAGEPDLAPVLAAVAADAALRLGARSRLSGLGTLPGKESDRLAGIAQALSAVGVDVLVEGREALALAPGGRRADDLVLDARGDHRIAFLHALLGLCVPGVRTRDARCVAKTWPGFFADLAAVGFALA